MPVKFSGLPTKAPPPSSSSLAIPALFNNNQNNNHAKSSAHLPPRPHVLRQPVASLIIAAAVLAVAHVAYRTAREPAWNVPKLRAFLSPVPLAPPQWQKHSPPRRPAAASTAVVTSGSSSDTTSSISISTDTSSSNRNQYQQPPPHLAPLCRVVARNQHTDVAWHFNSRALCQVAAYCMRPATSSANAHIYLAAAATASPRCALSRADLRVSAPADGEETGPAAWTRDNCLEVARKRVYCAHGRFERRDKLPACPQVAALDALSAAANASAKRAPPGDVAIVVPAFPFLHNIFHFSFVVGAVSQALGELPTLQASWRGGQQQVEEQVKAGVPDSVTVLFRGEHPRALGPWQNEILTAVLSARAAAVGVPTLNFDALGEDPLLKGAPDPEGNDAQLRCGSAAILIGDRGSVDQWPFANGSSVPVVGGGASVPVEALAFRRAIYDAFNVKEGGDGKMSATFASGDGGMKPVARMAARGSSTARPSSGRRRLLQQNEQQQGQQSGGARLRIPDIPRGGAPWPRTAVLPVPPLVVGYARRMTVPDPKPGATIRDYWRRFSDADDKWFVSMLQSEAARVGGSYRELRPTEAMDVGEQVRWFASVGFVAGIHGANLVNIAATQPFGALLELLPHGLFARCYVAGGNAGLAYDRHVAQDATLAESFCNPKARCGREKQQKRIKVESEDIRREITAKVRAAVERLQRLHKTFGQSGIPVRYEDDEARYVIDHDGWRDGRDGKGA